MTINRPALRRLCAALRDPSSWPRDFEWDYLCYGTCAIGLAARIGLIPRSGNEYDMATALGISDADSRGVFILKERSLPDSEVTPFIVADALEELLARQAST